MKSKYPDYQSSHRFVIFSLQMQKIEYHHFAQVEVDFGQVHIVWWLSYCQVGEKISVEPCILNFNYYATKTVKFHVA